MRQRPFVLLIDDGELEDVAQLLEDLGVRPMRMLGGPGQDGWPQPERLLLVSGRRALQLGHPTGDPGGDPAGQFARIAVADSPSRTLRARLENMGFDSILCRPAHPEVMRLVVEGALHGGREQRSRVRLPAGCEVAWRAGMWRRRGTLTEISARGCRILVRESSRPPQVSLLLPRGLAGEREIQLPGQIVRSQRKAGHVVSLSILFDRLEMDVRRGLSRFLSSLRAGPPTLVG